MTDEDTSTLVLSERLREQADVVFEDRANTIIRAQFAAFLRRLQWMLDVKEAVGASGAMRWQESQEARFQVLENGDLSI